MIKFDIQDWAISSENSSEKSDELTIDAISSTSDKRIKIGAPQLNIVPASLKRRFSIAARHVFNTLGEKYFADIPIIYACQHGQLQTTIDLINSYHDEISPTQFSLSVQNTVAGLISIASKSNQPYCVIDSLSGILEHALIEANTWLAKYPQVGVIYFDDKLPNELIELREPSELTELNNKTQLTNATNQLTKNSFAIALVIKKGEQYSIDLSSKQYKEHDAKSADFLITDDMLAKLANFLTQNNKQEYISNCGRLSWTWQRN